MTLNGDPHGEKRTCVLMTSMIYNAYYCRQRGKTRCAEASTSG